MATIATTKDDWPEEVNVLEVKSSVDGTHQPTLFYAPTKASESNRRPLLVALHTWSADYTQTGGQVVFADWCIRHGWYFLHPNFRGPNTSPSACGSDLAIQDVLDAVDHVGENGSVDPERTYVSGVSGGGHMALLLAARHPHRWAGVTAWAAISDLEAWWTERSSSSSGPAFHQKYAGHIESAVGGKPDGSQTEPINECRKRSPLNYLAPEIAKQVSLDINAGITDGREGGSVPFSHSLRAFDVLSSKKLESNWIFEAYQNQQFANHVGPSTDPLYGTRKIHYRDIQHSARITIFEGGHEILHVAALNWLEQQRLGQKAVWDIPSDNVDWIQVGRDQTQSGK